MKECDVDKVYVLGTLGHGTANVFKSRVVEKPTKACYSGMVSGSFHSYLQDAIRSGRTYNSSTLWSDFTNVELASPEISIWAALKEPMPSVTPKLVLIEIVVVVSCRG